MFAFIILSSQDHFTLACLQGATLECKSVVLSLAFIARFVFLFGPYVDIQVFLPFQQLHYHHCHFFAEFDCFSTCRFINLEDIMAASRLEEEFQVEIWGVVEGGHDMDRLNNAVRLSSVGTFMSLYRTPKENNAMWQSWKK